MNEISKNPYVGPRTFQREERHLFFGRDREANDLLALAVSEPLVLFYAQSGAGKSSLINTRLIPELEDYDYKVLPVGRVSGGRPEYKADIKVGNVYLENLMESLVQRQVERTSLTDLTLSQFLRGLKESDNGFVYEEHATVEVPTEKSLSQQRHALIIDQFEEIFTTSPEAWEKRTDFFQQLAQAMQEDPYLWIILVMREDHIAALDPYAHLLPGGLRVRYYMQRLGREAAIEAVEGPVEKQGCSFGKGVASKLVDDLSSIKVQRQDATAETDESDTQPGQYVEPVQLQVVCSRLWELWQKLPSRGTTITMENLIDVGDVSQSLGEYYAERVKNVAEGEQTQKEGGSEHAIRTWFGEELIAPGGIRGMVLRVPKGKSGTLNDDIVQRFQGDLVRPERRGGAIWYELTHDRLVEPILENNQKWFDEHASLLQKQTALWAKQGKPDGLLLRGEELDQAIQDSQTESKTITGDEREFLAKCINARSQERREKRGNFLVRILAIGTTIFLVIAIIFGFQAREQATTAEQALTAAAEAGGKLDVALGQARGLNTELLEAHGREQAEALAGQALNNIGQSETLQLGRLLSVKAYDTNKQAGSILPSVHQALVNSIQEGNDKSVSDRPFSSASFRIDNDIERLIVDNQLWNMNDIEISKLDPDASEVIQNAFLSSKEVVLIVPNKDYYYYYAGQNPYNANIINITNQDKQQIPLAIPDDADLVSVDLSKNGRWVILTFWETENGGMLIWDLLNPGLEPKQLRVQSPYIWGVAISPDGKYIAAVDEYYLYIWKEDKTDLIPRKDILIADILLDTGYMSGSLAGESKNGLQFSSDGRWLAMQTENNIRVFDAETQKLYSGTTPQQDDEMLGFLFSKDGKYIVYVTRRNQDYMLFRWLLEDGNTEPDLIYNSRKIEITTMDISPNGRLVIGDEAGYVRTWNVNLDSTEPLWVTSAHSGKIVNLAIGPDDLTIVSASDVDGTRKWNLVEHGSEAIVEQRIPSTVSSLSGMNGEGALAVGGIDLETGDGVVHIYSNLQNPGAISDLVFDSGIGSGLQSIEVSDNWIAAGRTYKRSYYSTPSYYLDLWERHPANEGSGSTSFVMEEEVSSLAIDPDETSLAIATKAGTICIENPKELSKVKALAIPTPGSESLPPEIKLPCTRQLPNDMQDIQTLVFTQNAQYGKYLIVAGLSEVRIWDMNNMGMYLSIPNATYPIKVSADQKWLLTAGSDSAVHLFDIEHLATAPGIVIPADVIPISKFAFDAKNQWLAIANKTGKVSIYRLPIETSSQRPTLSRGPTSEITWLEFSPTGSDKQWLAASSGSDIYLWDINKPTNKPIRLTLQEKEKALYVSFAKDASWVMAASTGQTLKFWSMDLDKMSETACSYAGRNLTLAEWETYFSGQDYTKTCPDYALEEQVASQIMPTTTPGPTLAFIPPPPTATATPPPAYVYKEYTVQSGDTLSLIALKYGIDMNILIVDNNITDPNSIILGQKLKIRLPNTSAAP